MRILLLIFGIHVGFAALGTPAQAQNYPWCALYSGGDQGGASNCGFTTYQQCMTNVSGIGGFCMPNTMYQPPRASGRRTRRAYPQ